MDHRVRSAPPVRPGRAGPSVRPAARTTRRCPGSRPAAPRPGRRCRYPTRERWWWPDPVTRRRRGRVPGPADPRPDTQPGRRPPCRAGAGHGLPIAHGRPSQSTPPRGESGRTSACARPRPPDRPASGRPRHRRTGGPAPRSRPPCRCETAAPTTRWCGHRAVSRHGSPRRPVGRSVRPPSARERRWSRWRRSPSAPGNLARGSAHTIGSTGAAPWRRSSRKCRGNGDIRRRR